MVDPQPLLTMPAGTPVWVAGWVSALFQYLLAPTIVGVVAARLASRQFRHAVISERQRSAAKLIDELTVFGRKVDERLRFCDIAFVSQQIGDLPMLEDLQLPEVREAAAALGPKVAMQHQMLKDALARSSEEVTFLLQATNKVSAVQQNNQAVQAIATFMAAAIEDVLVETYRTIRYAAASSRLPYKQNTRVPLSTLEKRKGLRIQLHTDETPKRLSIIEMIERGSEPAGNSKR